MDGPSWVELVERNVARFGDLVAGIDPSLSDLPEFFGNRDDGIWIDRFVNFVIDTIEGRIGFVKFQSAYFEACGLPGLAALSSGIKKARAAGIGVILDAKRGDIGATAAAYAHAYLTPAAAGGSGDFEADFAEQARFFERHLKPWAARMFADLEVSGPANFYRAVGRVGRVFMELESEAFTLSE